MHLQSICMHSELEPTSPKTLQTNVRKQSVDINPLRTRGSVSRNAWKIGIRCRCHSMHRDLWAGVCVYERTCINSFRMCEPLGNSTLINEYPAYWSTCNSTVIVWRHNLPGTGWTWTDHERWTVYQVSIRAAHAHGTYTVVCCLMASEMPFYICSYLYGWCLWIDYKNLTDFNEFFLNIYYISKSPDC